MRLGYNTNGLSHHEPFRALELLAEIGYQSVAWTLDRGWLDPFDLSLPRQCERLRRRLEQLGMHSVLETGARFLLDQERKHEPTLVSDDPADRNRRVQFLRRAIDIATDLGSDCLSLWSGTVNHHADNALAMDRLRSGLERVVRHAEHRGVTIGFEPEPGMLIDTMAQFERLMAEFPQSVFQLTLDVGHLHCLGEVPIPPVIDRYGARIVNIHLEDMRRGVHDHLMFGEGEIEFSPIFAALRRVGYQGGVHVELSRHGHVAPLAARQAYEFLAPLLS
ncbi:MAG: sugar phosphate isomerase/epimerase [Planctomycetes bacterium]|nr:sugar phosphate isomerase/epimerase [Planctomycetota bacterium]